MWPATKSQIPTRPFSGSWPSPRISEKPERTALSTDWFNSEAANALAEFLENTRTQNRYEPAMPISLVTLENSFQDCAKTCGVGDYGEGKSLVFIGPTFGTTIA
jgi:hypothetical protein